MAKQVARKFVLIRTFSAGVHVGELVSRKGREVTLTNARRVWSWHGANTLHEIALRGVGAGSKVSDPVASIVLTEAIEVIECTPASIAVFAGALWG